MDDFKKEMKDVSKAVIPIVIVCFLLIWVLPMNWVDFVQFMIGAVMTVLGLGIFLFGVKIALLPLGESIGAGLPKMASFPVVLIFGLILGFVVTAAEPDLRILASQIGNVAGDVLSPNMLIYSSAVGVAFFVMISLIRSIRQIKLIYILLPSYTIVLILSFMVEPDFLAIAFDAAGVTTGPVTVPFILALNLGVVSVLADRNNLGSGFGLVALASIGPIIAVLLVGVFMGG